jgi:hypothetical protein
MEFRFARKFSWRAAVRADRDAISLNLVKNRLKQKRLAACMVLGDGKNKAVF